MFTTPTPAANRWGRFAWPLSWSRASDLTPDPFPELQWEGAGGESLEKLRKYVIGEAQEAINWYLRRRRWKRRGAQITRVGAITAVTVASVIPVLAQLLGSDGRFAFNPGWGTVVLAGAALLVALDYFYGYTSSWVRYLDAEQRIARIVYEFQFDWERLRAGWVGAPPPTLDQVATALARLRNAVLGVQQVVEDETSLWATEFRSTLKQLDDAARTRPTPMPAAAGANVTVTNGAALDDGWGLAVGDGQTEQHWGIRAALTDLKPGPCRFVAEGVLKGCSVRDELTVEVPQQGIVDIRMTLN
ncbi:Uncharacterized protein OS=Beggiatoa sp. PS GN=BGP_4009 PE=4 SV=1: DUF4231 [Gemmata massiliana]|uniref:SMODS and SLOG-associating 2TM effector domain-containing protein n=1 Tax=Gemmata massiliana TaxID=1210884 RepID=A0A6P2CVW0_9BACT|nr:SLATT domain-containing protein [Gemmata massiliana]VTR92536.1 Uncharacterized protein OS=Beggiatoa sp. PS GN=BGP_4009 PE=4 SV=1: DUF4231 [Gemmata massiliana]